ncbi:FAD-dependent oxidoreductase [Haloglycomyces albus]|uniref:FAD-dependent oxidoreductase n=1 Tax=Haloglycomyces albus TaxID=526067 RepID=UPI00046D419D|nr:FAD-dependent oxidoreductase [Haloglycomyces albus]
MYDHLNSSDVIVIGAGPTGLLLAGDLAERGKNVTVLEKRSSDISNLSRAFGVHARTLEVFDIRGLAEPLLSKEVTRVRRLRLFGRGTLRMDHIRSRYNFVLIAPQYDVEAVLRERAKQAGARFRFRTEVTGLDQDSSTVRVQTTAGDYHARFVVGCDGVHSAVRRALAVSFDGVTVLSSIMLGDVRMSDPPDSSLTADSNGEALAFSVPFGDGWYRVFAWNRNDREDDAPVDFERMRATYRSVTGTDHGMHSPRWLSRFHSDERLAGAFRVGRVFLAGDAAHCHSPAGGMGMNTGLQDAANLSWRIALALDGSGDDVLDGYESERLPVARMVVRLSGALVRMGTLRNVMVRATRDAILPVTNLGIVARTGAERVSGISIAYARPSGSDKRVGRRVPDIPLHDGRRLYEALRDGRFLAVNVNVEHPLVARVGADSGIAPAFIVRPDGYVAWAGKTSDSSGAIKALNRLTARPSAQV